MPQIIFVALALGTGCALQSAVGFGLGLLAIPLMIWAGVDLPTTVTISICISVAQTGWSCWQLREDLPWRVTMPFTYVRVLTLPLGVVLMGMLAGLGQTQVKQAVGIFLLVTLAAQWIFKVQPRHAIHPVWTLIAGSTSGLLTGMIGMGGPPLVLWAMAHDWPQRRARAFIWLNALLLYPLAMLMLWLRFGSPVLQALAWSVAFLPVALIGTALGMKCGNLMSRQHLRMATLVVLICLGVSSVISPLF